MSFLTLGGRGFADFAPIPFTGQSGGGGTTFPQPIGDGFPGGGTTLVPGPGDITNLVQRFGCGILTAVPGICANPISRAAAEALCPGGCGELPTFDDMADPRDFINNLPTVVPGPGNGGVRGACPSLPSKNECNIPVNTKCGVQMRKGRLQVDCNTGQAVCVPKKRRMNPMNAQANRRSMSRLKGAHREAKKIIDTLDKFAKPRRSRAPSRAAKCAC